MTFPLLQIKDLSIAFKSDRGIHAAVNHISFDVEKGETVAIVGESGSGKTVTSLSILHLLTGANVQYTSGEILFSNDGKEQVSLRNLSEKKLCNIRGNSIAMIFQEPMTSLNPLKQCGLQVTEAIRLHNSISRKKAREKTIFLFQKVKLKNPDQIFSRYPFELSGGQKQRVMIAMAMSCNPSLLIADEPTTALDVTVQKSVLQLLKELQQEYGLSIIYITHDLELVANIADRVLVMYKGTVVESNEVKSVFSNPLHPYTKALIACRPSQTSKGRRLPVVSDFMNGTLSNNSDFHFDTFENALSHNSGEVLLTVDSLSVSFPGKKSFTGRIQKDFIAVNNVSFVVHKEEILGLVGESGCGKTTLGRAILRLTEPTSGQIILHKTDITKLSPEELRKMRKDIQIVFQDPYGSLNPRLTIGAAIDEPMKVHDILPTEKARKEKIIDLLEKVELKPEHFNRYPHEFSGGQRQRICLARALSLNPDFIICDESVSALDVSVQAQVLNLLNDLRAELGFTCIFISHDLAVVYYISDRIMVMHDGQIVETGAADDIYYRPKNEYTKTLINSIPQKGGISLR
jgi:peptide/nickel transport system ATP-binding protein